MPLLQGERLPISVNPPSVQKLEDFLTCFVQKQIEERCLNCVDSGFESIYCKLRKDEFLEFGISNYDFLACMARSCDISR